MLRIPASLEHRLTQRFPKSRDREKFVVEAIEDALGPEGQALPEYVGGVIHLFTDGGSRGNPGQAAIGCILEDPVRGIILKEHFDRIGVETNNVAEYRALIEGLKLALNYQPSRLVCHLDSELIVKQLNGEYQVKMPTLKPYFDEIKELVQEFADVLFVHIPREDNYRADALVNRALDELPSPSRPMRPAPSPPPSNRRSPPRNSSQNHW